MRRKPAPPAPRSAPSMRTLSTSGKPAYFSSVAMWSDRMRKPSRSLTCERYISSLPVTETKR